MVTALVFDRVKSFDQHGVLDVTDKDGITPNGNYNTSMYVFGTKEKVSYKVVVTCYCYDMTCCATRAGADYNMAKEEKVYEDREEAENYYRHMVIRGVNYISSKQKVG